VIVAIDQSYLNANSLANLLHSALEDVGDVQTVCDLARIQIALVENERGGTGDDSQTIDLRKNAD